MKIVALLIAVLSVASVAESPYTAVAFSPDHRQVLLGSQRGIEVRSWPELAIEATIPTELIHVHEVCFSPDGKTLLAAGGSPAENGAVEMLSWPDRKLVRRVECHADVIYAIAFSPDGLRWATASADGICQVFEMNTGRKLSQYEGHSRAVLSLRFTLDGQTIASCGVDQTLRLWDSKTGKHVRTLDNHVGSVTGLAIRPSYVNLDRHSNDEVTQKNSDSFPTMLATISEDKTVRLWQPAIGRLMRFTRLTSIPRALAWSVSGDRLFVGCNDGLVRVLDSDSMEVAQVLDGFDGRIHEIVVDPNGRSILIAGEGILRIAIE